MIVVPEREHVEVTACNVSKRYGGEAVLTSASLHVAPGETLGLLGANGAGKTTLLRVLLACVNPDSGAVGINGLDPAVAVRRYDIAYFGGAHQLPATVRVSKWSRYFGLPRNYGTAQDRQRIGRLSRGQRQFLGLRTAIGFREPQLVILDEPWDGLDLRAVRWLNQRLRVLVKLGATIIVSSHRLHDLTMVCTRYAVLHGGRLQAIDPRAAHESDAADSLYEQFEQLTGTLKSQ